MPVADFAAMRTADLNRFPKHTYSHTKRQAKRYCTAVADANNGLNLPTAHKMVSLQGAWNAVSATTQPQQQGAHAHRAAPANHWGHT
jgi:membrane protease subunit (stomatin/prohibitin family)